jgi:Xaa-Pro aminopeptidase
LRDYILKSQSALYHECGFSCDNGIFLKLGSESFFITDGRYTLDAKQKIKDKALVIEARDIIKKAREILVKNRVKRVTIDPKEWSLEEFEKVSSLKIFFQKSPNLSQKKRIIKTPHEIDIIADGVKIANERFEEFAKRLEAGFGEKRLNFLAHEILTNYGQNPLSFEPITAIDANSALPHAVAGDIVLKNGSILLFDAGIKHKNYCTDRTRVLEFEESRVLNFNKEQSFKNKKAHEVYTIVKDANNLAISKVKPGIKAKEIDKTAREYIEKKGYGDKFVHSTGHGVGLDIHELPIISSKSETILEEGMVFTIEPGVYIENEFGIRVEDMVVVTSDGCRVFGEDI